MKPTMSSGLPYPTQYNKTHWPKQTNCLVIFTGGNLIMDVSSWVPKFKNKKNVF